MPNPSPERRIDALARRALDHPPSERHAFLQAACDTPDLRNAVHARIDALLEDADTIAAGEADSADADTADADSVDADATETALPPPEAPTEPATLPADVPAGTPDSGKTDPDEDAEQDAERTQTQTAPDRPDAPTVDAPTVDAPTADAPTVDAPTADADRTQTQTEQAPASPIPPPPFQRPMKRVGPWRLVRIIGRGGMGAVHLAERDDGQFQQRAALKLIRHDLGPAAQKRFLSERQILAQLQHPNIAHLLDGGVTEDGSPYFAMEYVDGTPLDVYCNANGLDVEARLRLFRQVCDAVQFAHRNLIVHRDLKPGNILVTERGTGTQTRGTTGTGTGPHVKLLDFGIAKALEGADANAAGLTRTGEGGPMTPSYAAPEQVEGLPITTATDVYALGVVLCELLTGALPYDVRGRSMVEAAKIIVNEEPKPLSQQVVTRLSDEAAQAYGTSSETLRRTLRGDLDVIVEKALRKEPERRYVSAAELGQDIGRYLNGMPVEARPATTGYRVRRFVDRNRPAVLGAAGALVALLVGLGVAVWQGQVAAAERDRAQQQAIRARTVQTFLIDMIERAAPAVTGGDALTVREVLREADAELNTPALQAQPEVTTDVRVALGRMHRVLGQGSEAVRQGRLAYETSRQARGMTDSLTLLAGTQYGMSLLRNGQIPQADSLYRALLPRLRQGRARPALHFSLLSHYGEVLRYRSRLDSAEALLQESLDWYDRMAQPDTTLLSTALSNLAGVYRRQGRLEEAEQTYRRALTLAEENSTEERELSIAILTNNLANVQRQRGNIDASEQMFRRALDLSTTLFGEDSPNVAAILTNLSRVLSLQGDLQEADRLSARAVALHRDLFPQTDYRIGFALNVRTSILQLLGRLNDARASAEEALRLFQTNLGPQHPRTAGMHRTLAAVHREQNNLSQAAEHGTAALAAYRATFDSTHMSLAAARGELAATRTAQGQYDKAERLLQDAHRVLEGTAQTELHQQIHARLAALYEAWGRPEEARRWNDEGG